MNSIVIIGICLLASVGLVQTLSWLAAGIRRPAREGALQVVALRSDPEALEAQLRRELFLLRWSAGSRPGHLILLDTGLDEESKAICRNLLSHSGAAGVRICSPAELAGLAEHLTQSYL